MAERPFVKEVEKLRLPAGEVFPLEVSPREGILALVGALPESGISCVAGRAAPPSTPSQKIRRGGLRRRAQQPPGQPGCIGTRPLNRRPG
ncbi:hypothetical protein [Verminephrobacter eiseniae]|uniref:hypothetical protein n=1 Tax=Verminephrobacter eiseniae TaxID=364317 RepID=UPI002236FE21|nr:hypothetical protein [Verminephrobacter eiseniae]MCW5238408.1 hypothetical protein [Verminephrobacter eiseniae]